MKLNKYLNPLTPLRYLAMRPFGRHWYHYSSTGSFTHWTETYWFMGGIYESENPNILYMNDTLGPILGIMRISDYMFGADKFFSFEGFA